jgi:hypothetical protein
MVFNNSRIVVRIPPNSGSCSNMRTLALKSSRTVGKDGVQRCKQRNRPMDSAVEIVFRLRANHSHSQTWQWKATNPVAHETDKRGRPDFCSVIPRGGRSTRIEWQKDRSFVAYSARRISRSASPWEPTSFCRLAPMRGGIVHDHTSVHSAILSAETR